MLILICPCLLQASNRRKSGSCSRQGLACWGNVTIILTNISYIIKFWVLTLYEQETLSVCLTLQHFYYYFDLFFTLIVSRLYEEETLFVWLCSILCVQSVRSHSWVIATMRRKVWPTVRHTIISCLETSALSATVSSLAMVSLLTVYLSILLNCNTYVVFHILVSPNIERKNVGICYFHVFIHIKNSWYYNTLCHGDCCQNSKQNSMFWYFFYQNICNPKHFN